MPSSTKRRSIPTPGTLSSTNWPPPAKRGLTVNLSGLNQLIDYPHQDLTITVQAGMTINTLQKLLLEKQQTLPIDVPKSHEATVGGSIAANINGPRRTGWGTWRDYLIGFSWINDKGEEAKAGGRVVKNVASDMTSVNFFRRIVWNPGHSSLK